MNAQTKPREFQTPALFRLADAVRRFFPTGGITVRSLRTEARAGRLQLTRIANKDFVTAEAIEAMLERCTCPASESRPAFTSANVPAATPNGSSVMERAKLARAAALMILPVRAKRLKSS